eukprot:scaffold337294_cov63-Attheya_sp.AAC.1
MIGRSYIWLILLVCLANRALGFGGVSNRVFVSTPVTTRRFVNDCMTSNPCTFTASMPVEEAMAMLLELGVSGAPVVDDETGTTLIGVVSSFDFLQKEAGGGSLLPMEGSADRVEGYIDAAKKICAKQVGEIMTPNPTTVKPNATMRSAAGLMAKERLNRVPVVDDAGAIVGILTSSDIMQDLLYVVRSLPPQSDAMHDYSSEEKKVGP